MTRKLYKLVPELVPGPLWGISAHRLFGDTKPWRMIRQDALKAASNRCQFCGSRKPRLACHDKWRYDDKKRVAKLIGFEIRCALCHLATHIGRAAAIGYEKEAVQQLRKVNRCTKKEVELMIEVAMLEWRIRSAKKWTVIVAPALLKRYPRLEVVTLSVKKR